jgi:hypothetical protein
MNKFLKKIGLSLGIIALFGSAVLVSAGCECDKKETETDAFITSGDVTNTEAEVITAEVTSEEAVVETPEEPVEATITESGDLSEFDQMRTALLEESGIDLPENPDAVVTEFFHETFDEGDTVVGGRFAVGDDYVGQMKTAITAVMGDPVQEEESDEYKFYVWSQPTEKENVVNECVVDLSPEGETSIKYHKDLDMNY